MIQFIWFTFVLFNFSSSTKYQFFSSSCFCNYCWFQMRILNMYYLVFKLFHKNYIALMALSISISFHFRRTPWNWTGNLNERQEHSGAVWANSQLLFWSNCFHNKNIKRLRICPHCLAVSFAFVHIFCLSSWCLLKTKQNWNRWSQICCIVSKSPWTSKGL